MQVEGVDERTSKWERSFPVYHVYFFSAQRASYTYRIVNAHSVHQVLAWADAYASSRHYVVYVEVEDSTRGMGLLQLAGTDPNAADHDPRRTAPDTALPAMPPPPA